MLVNEVRHKSFEQRDKRAQAIAAILGLVRRERDHFQVAVPTLRGEQLSYEVRRDENGEIQCSCTDFQKIIESESDFRCEHILAVKHALAAGNRNGANDKSITESRQSERGEQKIEADSTKALTGRQVEREQIEPARLRDTKGEKEMKPIQVREEAAIQSENMESIEIQDNVLNFSTTLKELRKNVDPHLVKQREGWRDRNGNVQMVDYVEWHTVADILDDSAPNWAHTVKDIRQVGDIMTVTVAITIDGVTREGIGTGLAQSEMGIKKAEHDALKRAAVKFGIARDLYRKESDTIEREGSVSTNGDDDFPANPVAANLVDLVTAKQLGMIRSIGREIGVDADEECQKLMSCKTDALSKKAASALIQHLQEIQRKGIPAQTPLRKVS